MEAQGVDRFARNADPPAAVALGGDEPARAELLSNVDRPALQVDGGPQAEQLAAAETGREDGPDHGLMPVAVEAVEQLRGLGARQRLASKDPFAGGAIKSAGFSCSRRALTPASRAMSRTV